MPDPGPMITHPLLADTPNLRRRRRVNRLLEIAAWAAAVLAVAVLAIVIASIFVKGIGSLNLDFLTQVPATFGESGGGIAPALVGTGVLVGLATLMAVPVGILIAIYTSEFASPRSSFAIRYVLDILNGVPTIITGIFVVAIVVTPQGHQSGMAGSVALAIVMLPLVARSSHEVLTLVPSAVKEAGLALGVSRWRTVISVVLPSAFGGMVTGALLAIARAAGETAPLLLTTSIFANLVSTDPSQPVASIPMTIFTDSQSPDPALHSQAWTAALLLIFFVLLLSTAARLFAARAKKRLQGAR